MYACVSFVILEFFYSLVRKNMSKDVKQKILEIFDRHRKDPSEDFDESHFIDFLQASPKFKGSIRNSFSGLKRFNSFWDEVQLEFSICFKLSDREKIYSLNDFVERIEELDASRKSSLSALRYQMKQRIEWQIFVFMNVLLLFPVVFLKSYSNLMLFYVIIVLYINYKFFIFYVKGKKYRKRLFEGIQRRGN